MRGPFIIFTLIGVLLVRCSLGLENGLGRTPAMGYNTWFDLGCSGQMNEEYFIMTVQAYEILNLAKFGYQYFNLDDCWADGRYANGTVYPNALRFPQGLGPLIEYVHIIGLKFGLYTDRGTQTCAGKPGSYGYEAIDAATYAQWGVDFLKEDSCNASDDHDTAFQEYATMRDALNKTGRPIFFDACGWYSWYAPVGTTLANEWRIGPDDSNWESILVNINIDADLAKYAGPGGFNNPCLLLGSDVTGTPLITEQQSRAQFSMWSILAAPLMLSQNIRNLSSFMIDTYTNVEVIQVDQDPLGKQGVRLVGGDLHPNATTAINSTNVWARPLQDGSWAVVFINVGPKTQTVTCDKECFGAMGFNSTAATVVARDLWLHKTVWTSSSLTYSSDIAGNGGVQMLKLSVAKV